MNQALDDIIKSKRFPSGGTKGKFNAFRSNSAPGNAKRSGRQLLGGRLGLPTSKAAAAAPSIASRLGDARMKIIAKKRQNLVDARDQLNEIARQSDARDKLIMIRAQKIAEHPKSLFTKALGNLKGGGVAKQRHTKLYTKPLHTQGFVVKRQKQIPLQSLTRTVQLSPEHVPRNYLQVGRLGRAQPMHDIDIEVYNDLDAVDRISPNRGGRDGRERLPDYDELLAMYARNKMQRAVPEKPVAIKKPVFRLQAVRKAPALRMDQYVEEESAEEEEEDGMDVDEAPPQATKFMGRTIQSKQQPSNMFRRVQNPPPASSRLSAFKKQATEGFRVRVSNLAPSVTKDDIMELFSDPGPLSHWDLHAGGIAEVFYKKRSDAINAVDAYHKRLLDGQPMTVTFFDR